MAVPGRFFESLEFLSGCLGRHHEAAFLFGHIVCPHEKDFLSVWPPHVFQIWIQAFTAKGGFYISSWRFAYPPPPPCSSGKGAVAQKVIAPIPMNKEDRTYGLNYNLFPKPEVPILLDSRVSKCS